MFSLGHKIKKYLCSEISVSEVATLISQRCSRNRDVGSISVNNQGISFAC